MGIDELKDKVWNQNNTFSLEFYGGPLTGLEHCIKSISMPDFTRSAVEEYNKGTWQFTHGRQEMYQVAITFWDNEADDVYNTVLKYWNESHLKYTDDRKFNFDVSKALRYDRDAPGTGVQFKDAIIDSISGLQWDNSSQSQLLEFTVNIKTAKFETS